MKAHCVSLVCLVFAAGCTVGVKFDTTHVGDIRRGQHDKSQIASWFGQPLRVDPIVGNPLGCTERWTYTHAFSTGSRTRSETLVVDFGPDARVCDTAFVQQ